MDLLELLKTRYTTKHYDASKKVDEALMDKIMECVRLTPTSTNHQPYHFFVLSGEAKDALRPGIKESGEAKDALRPGIKDFNMSRYDDSTYAVVIANLKSLSESHLEAVLEADEKAGRLPTAELKEAQAKSRMFFANLHMENGDFNAWACKQAYMAMTTMVYAAAAYGVDSTMMEGIDYGKVDEILELSKKNLTTSCVVTFGYRAVNDSNQVNIRPKSRLTIEQLVTKLK